LSKKASVFSAVDYAEGRLVASTHHGLACMLIAAEDAGENTHLLQNMAELIRLARCGRRTCRSLPWASKSPWKTPRPMP
jgi:hypothetical protein